MTQAQEARCSNVYEASSWNTLQYKVIQELGGLLSAIGSEHYDRWVSLSILEGYKDTRTPIIQWLGGAAVALQHIQDFYKIEDRELSLSIDRKLDEEESDAGVKIKEARHGEVV